MCAIGKSESFQVIGFNKDGSQMRLCSAASLEKLLIEWSKSLTRHVSTGVHNILPSFTKITVWNVDAGFTGFDLPYIETVVA